MSKAEYPYALGIQTVLPQNSSGEPFRQRLALLQEMGFTGIELNIVRPEQVPPAELRSLLSSYGLRMTMFASGATAKAEGLSLSHEDSAVRARSVQRAIDFIKYAAEFGAGVIVGFLKGGPAQDRRAAHERFQDSLSQLDKPVRETEVPLLVEATNRYEASVANTLAEAAALIGEFNNPWLRILPDTFHMNIEEQSTPGSLARFAGLYESVHISDNNRLFPGLGGIDFGGILRFLRDAAYQGGIAIEGNIRDSFEEDLRASMSLLSPTLLQLS